MTRTKNKIISLLRALKYRVTEPILLRVSRLVHHKDYLRDEEPLVSIIIATYNRSQILVNRTIQSVLSQSYENIEVVVVGDCCIDDTKELIRSIKDKRVKFIDLAKRGNYPEPITDRWFVQGSKPRNEGMKIASGSWFAFISDDDVLYPNHIETLLRKAIKTNAEFISGAYDATRDGKKITVYPGGFDVTRPELKCGGMPTWLYRSYLRVFKWNLQSWRKTYNRPVDLDLATRFNDAGVTMGVVNDVIALVPAVEGTDTVGFDAALIVDGREPRSRDRGL